MKSILSKLRNIKALNFILMFGIVLFSCPCLKGQEIILTNKVEGLQHAGAVHFYLMPGMTEIEIFKQDHAGYNPVNQIMRTILTGADGTVHDSLTLKGTNQGKVRLDVEQEGIYTLFVSMNNDQQMKSITWGFRTNAIFYMINSGAGHADGKRSEPIVLDGLKNMFSVFFKPEKQTFSVGISGLSQISKHIEIYDGNGKLYQRSLQRDGMVKMTVDTENDRGIWELRLPEQRGTILIEGITHDWKDDIHPLPVWTTTRESYFDMANYHWLISPRRFARNIQSGDVGVVNLNLYNSSETEMPLELSLINLPETGNFTLSTNTLIIQPKSNKLVSINYDIPHRSPPGYYNFNLITRDVRSNKQAYSLVELRVDTTEKLTLPIQLNLFEHNQFQFAFESDLPSANQFYFDIENRPWTVAKDGLKFLKGDIWETIDIPSGKGTVTYQTSTIGTDSNGFIYTIIHIDQVPYLVKASSNGSVPELARLPVGGHYKMEVYMGGKASGYPPAVLRYHTDKTKRAIARWARKYRLELFVVSIEGGNVSVGEPLLITDKCVGISDHSGLTNSLASDGHELHVIWGEVSESKDESGVPTYTRSYNRNQHALSPPVLLAYAPPVNDVHNMSTFLTDNKGNHHVVVGAHGRSFQYLTRYADSEEWTDPIKLTKSGQTYAGAVLDGANGIHLFGRTWRKSDMYPDTFDAALSYQHKGIDGKWTSSIFALPPLPGYSIYYHRVTVDRLGRLYLSIDYWSTWSPYRDSYTVFGDSKNRKEDRIVFVSENGKNFVLLDKQYLKRGIQKWEEDGYKMKSIN